jgi:RNA polymerase sigma-70 factor (ECF subfamily)
MPPRSAFAETVELIQRAKAGEEACLGRVLERYRERLLVRVRWMMGNEARRFADSGDFLQGVFVKILEHFDTFEMRDESSFLRWATQIARNGIRDDLCRKREVALESLTLENGIWPTAPSGDGPPDQIAERAEQIGRLVDSLSELDEDQRRVVELRHFELLPFAEIGRRLGKTENAVQLLHTRVLLRLNKLLQERADA